jgi:Fe-S-cluster containining protein
MSTTESTPEPVSEPDDPFPVNGYRARLCALYAELDEAVAALGPVCQLSGRCCRFNEYGHTLFVSSPEAELLLADAPRPSRPLDDGATCPWQDALGRCTARDARPLGCRVYFCDPDYQLHAPEVAERFITRLKRMVEELGLPWGYAPLHDHLRKASGEGRLPATAVDES